MTGRNFNFNGSKGFPINSAFGESGSRDPNSSTNSWAVSIDSDAFGENPTEVAFKVILDSLSDLSPVRGTGRHCQQILICWNQPSLNRRTKKKSGRTNNAKVWINKIKNGK